MIQFIRNRIPTFSFLVKKRVIVFSFMLSGPLIWIALYFAKNGDMGWKENMSMIVITIFGVLFGGVVALMKR